MMNCGFDGMNLSTIVFPILENTLLNKDFIF